MEGNPLGDNNLQLLIFYDEDKQELYEAKCCRVRNSPSNSLEYNAFISYDCEKGEGGRRDKNITLIVQAAVTKIIKHGVQMAFKDKVDMCGIC